MDVISKLQRGNQYTKRLLTVSEDLDQLKVLTAQNLIHSIAARGDLPNIQEAEFKVFSQFGEDGILQYLIRKSKIAPHERSFVEFGVETYVEANTRLLAIHNNWRGLVIDGSPENVERIQNDRIYWRHELTAVASFITAENINSIIGEAGFRGEIGLLSIDIDGNDYWVWNKIDVVNPVIVVAEYNSVFGGEHAITVPYDPSFVRGQAHYSHLYWGCSIAALAEVANRKGYALVGSNSAGNNVFFVRRDRLNGLKELKPSEAYVESRFREARDRHGKLTYVSGPARASIIGEMPVHDVKQGKVVRLDSFSGLGGVHGR